MAQTRYRAAALSLQEKRLQQRTWRRNSSAVAYTVGVPVGSQGSQLALFRRTSPPNAVPSSGGGRAICLNARRRLFISIRYACSVLCRLQDLATTTCDAAFDSSRLFASQLAFASYSESISKCTVLTFARPEEVISASSRRLHTACIQPGAVRF